jgi:hypothetical protein
MFLDDGFRTALYWCGELIKKDSMEDVRMLLPPVEAEPSTGEKTEGAIGFQKAYSPRGVASRMERALDAAVAPEQMEKIAELRNAALSPSAPFEHNASVGANPPAAVNGHAKLIKPRGGKQPPSRRRAPRAK